MKRLMVVSFISLMGYIGFMPCSQAVSEDECAIWLCLPAGFGEGCSGAHHAFEKRLSKGKSPLPSWHSCSEDDDEQAPYTFDRTFKTYTKFYRNNKTVINSGRPCPRSGLVHFGDKSYLGVEGICTVVELFEMKMKDDGSTYQHEEFRQGKPLSQTKG
ncbi:MAG TPA: hypothetical protein ACHBZ9_04875 [Arsenophonus nasoniae]|uniref:hypothetical protein n=1 Tax=Arsenophonus nasoniae TaxID=638 RepID=UPI0038792783